MDPHKQYNITPVHPNYHFEKLDHPNRYDYQSQKLANLKVAVRDQKSDTPVSNVKIVLSGPNIYRNVLKMEDTGDLLFPRLEPGDYFVIFEKKEFKFEPNKIELNLTGKDDITMLEVTASRYQFTAFGKLGSLSNSAFQNYKVEGMIQRYRSKI